MTKSFKEFLKESVEELEEGYSRTEIVKNIILKYDPKAKIIIKKSLLDKDEKFIYSVSSKSKDSMFNYDADLDIIVSVFHTNGDSDNYITMETDGIDRKKIKDKDYAKEFAKYEKFINDLKKSGFKVGGR